MHVINVFIYLLHASDGSTVQSIKKLTRLI